MLTLKRKKIQNLIIFTVILYITSYLIREYAFKYRLEFNGEIDTLNRDTNTDTNKDIKIDKDIKDKDESLLPSIDDAKISEPREDSSPEFEKNSENDEISSPLNEIKPKDYNNISLKNNNGNINNNNIDNIIRENATIFSLVRNEDLYSMLKTIRNVEDRFNKNYHYDWVFANDQPFSEEFITMARSFVSGHAYFVQIPTEMWSYPSWIDQKQAATVRNQMRRKKIKYGNLESYRHMCRFNGGFFYKLEEMKRYKYYWRVEPEIQFRCDINYDPFKMMREEDKIYGFNLAPLELHTTVATLWPTVLSYMRKYPKEIADDNNFLFLTDDNGKTFNMCHFWSNFEIADMDFFRSSAYEKFFNYLDKAGGIYYERWGDAPIHTIAVSILLPKDKLKFISDTGYYHEPNGDCPRLFETRLELGCECIPSTDFTWCSSSCIPKFFDIHDFKRPEGVPTTKYVPIHDASLRETEEEKLKSEEEERNKAEEADESAVNAEENNKE